MVTRLLWNKKKNIKDIILNKWVDFNVYNVQDLCLKTKILLFLSCLWIFLVFVVFDQKTLNQPYTKQKTLTFIIILGAVMVEQLFSNWLKSANNLLLVIYWVSRYLYKIIWLSLKVDNLSYIFYVIHDIKQKDRQQTYIG